MATKYVSTTGSDAAAGDSGTPWLTISYAVEQLSPGDTLYLRAGTYTGSENTIDTNLITVPSGTNWEAGAITIAGYPGDTAILRTPTGAVNLPGAVSYLIFRNFTIDMQDQTGTTVSAFYMGTPTHHIWLDAMTLQDGSDLGVQYNGHHHRFYNTEISGFGDVGGANTTGHGTYGGGNDHVWYRCHVHHCYGSGLMFNVDEDGALRNSFSKCIVHDIGRAGQSQSGILFRGATDSVASNNLVYNVTGYGCLAYTYAKNCQFYFNTIYNCSENGVRLEFYSSAPTVRNNIIYSNGTTITDAGGTGTPVLDHNLTSDPEFVDVGSPGFDFHILSTSDAIGAGVAVAALTTDYDLVTRPDPPAIGAYEFAVVAYTLVAQPGEYSHSGTAATLIKTPVEAVLPGGQVVLQARINVARIGASRIGYYTVNSVVTLNGVDITTWVKPESLHVTNALNDTPDTASFTIIPGSGLAPTNGQAVVIALGAVNNKIFAGTVARVTHRRLLGLIDTPWLEVECWDWRQLFNRRRVTAIYRASVDPTATIDAIVKNVMALYTSGFTSSHVQPSAVVPDLIFIDDETPSDVLTRLVHLNGGGGWYIDRDRDVHFFGPGGETAWDTPTPPLSLTNTRSTLLAFSHGYDGRDLRNRVIVRGASTRVMATVPNLLLTVLQAYGLPIEEGWMFADVSATQAGPGHVSLGPQHFTYTGGIALSDDVLTCVTTADFVVADLSGSLSVTDTTPFLTSTPSLGVTLGAGWAQDMSGGGQVFAYTATSLSTTVLSIPASTGYGAVATDIPAGTTIRLMPYLRGLSPASGATGFDEIPVGEEARVRYLADDTAAQATLAAIEGGDGVHESVVDAPTDTVLAAADRAAAELAAFAAATGVPEQAWTTRDMNATVGAQQPTAFTGSDPFSTTLTITQVEYEFFETPQPPKRHCTARNVKTPDLADVLTGD